MTTVNEAHTQTGPITGVDIVVNLTNDPQRAMAFYRDVLGMIPTEVDEQGRGAEFTLSDGSTFGVWQPDGGPASGATVMFSVDDIATAVPQLRARGAEISDPTETPVCHMAFASDPDGNGVIIHQRKPGN